MDDHGIIAASKGEMYLRCKEILKEIKLLFKKFKE